MAIFQFTVVLIPSQWVRRAGNGVKSLYCEDEYDVSEAWLQNQPALDIDPLLSNMLCERKSWDPELKVWGNEESHDIQVWYENGKIESITVRLDLREEISILLSKVVDIANKLDCYLFIPGAEQIIESNIFELKKLSSESNAAKFVKSPEGFLKDLESD